MVCADGAKVPRVLTVTVHWHFMSIPYAVLQQTSPTSSSSSRYCQDDLLPDGLNIILSLQYPMVVKEGHDITAPQTTKNKEPVPLFLSLLPSLSSFRASW